MSNRSCTPAPADGADRHQQQLAALHEQGPERLWQELGDQAYLLSEIAQNPGEMFDVDTHDSATYVQLLRTLHEARSAIDAFEARSVVALSGSTRREQIEAARDETAHEVDPDIVLEKIEKQADLLARTELTMATRRAPHAAGAALTRSRRIVRDMPHMLRALATGTVTAEVVYETARALGPLEDVDRRAVDRMLDESLPDLDAAGATRWKNAVTAAIGRLDPDGSTRRHQRAVHHRHVTVTPVDHAMASLHARLPARDAVLVRKRLSLEAERLRAAGDRRGHHAIMADCLVDTLLGREGGMDPTTLDIGMIITDRALLEPGAGDVAHIEGYGPVPVECVREELRAALREPEDPEDDPIGPDGPALRAVLRRLYTHPTTGELVAVESKARAFPAAMARFLSWRDTICRGPHCNAVIRQTDHIQPFARGGSTSLDNGQGLCAFCNQKELMARAIERLQGPGHRVQWTSQAGLTRTTTATPLTLPAPPQASASPQEPQPGRTEANAAPRGKTAHPAGDSAGPPEASPVPPEASPVPPEASPVPPEPSANPPGGAENPPMGAVSQPSTDRTGPPESVGTDPPAAGSDGPSGGGASGLSRGSTDPPGGDPPDPPDHDPTDPTSR